MVSRILIALALLFVIVACAPIIPQSTPNPISIVGYRTFITEDTNLVRVVIVITSETDVTDDIKAIRDLTNQAFRRNKSALITICERTYNNAFPDAAECAYTFLFVPDPSVLRLAEK